MPNPTAHADDMKSPAVIKPNEMPAFWWINPWGYALNLKRALHAVHLLSETTEDAYQAAKTVIKQKEQLADLHKTERYDFLRQVEVTLEAAGGPKGYHDTIDLVVWAADEIKRLKASLSVMTEDRDAYIEKLEKANAGRTLLVSRDKQIDGLFADIEREKQKVEAITIMCNERDRKISALEIDVDSLSRQLRTAKRKLAKAEKAKPLWEDKTKTLTHGVSFTAGNHEDRHDPVREAYASLGRKFIKAGIKAQAKAKKKGGRRA